MLDSSVATWTAAEFHLPSSTAEAFSALLASALSFLPNALTFGYGASAGRGLRTNQHMENAKVVSRDFSLSSFLQPLGSSSFGSLIPSSLVHLQDLDRSLKSSCEDLITYATLASTAPTRAFLLQATSYLSGSAPGSRDLAAQPWATPEKVLEVHEEVRKSVRRELKQWLGQLRMYLEDRKAVEVLIPPTQVSSYGLLPLSFGSNSSILTSLSLSPVSLRSPPSSTPTDPSMISLEQSIPSPSRASSSLLSRCGISFERWC